MMEVPRPANIPNGVMTDGSLFAAGFNAHSQLDKDHSRDVRSFCRVHAGEQQRISNVLFAGWSTTVLVTDKGLIYRGINATTVDIEEAQNVHLSSGFGDHNGFLGCLDIKGNLYYLTARTLSNVGSADSPLLSHIALAGNGRLAITFKQVPNGRLCHVAEFSSYNAFRAWYSDPSGEGNYPEKHHMLPGRPKQLVANAISFLLLMEAGEVYSWGDPRHRTLGRSINGENAAPADKPGLVDALSGMRVAKIAAGGWLSAALSHDKALYLWGSGTPGTEHSIKCISEAAATEAALVNLPDALTSEPLDIVDVAVGDAHVAVVTEDDRLFVVGDNRNGQLGVGLDAVFLEDFSEVTQLPNVSRVVCGPKATFAFATFSEG